MWLNQETTAGYFFAAPFIIGFVVFIVVPMLMSLYFSFCDYNILSPAKWIGFDNFKNLFNDPKFWKSLTVTLKYAFFSVPLKLIFSLLVALLLLRSTKLTPIYRGMYYLPSIMGASVAVSVLWKQLFGNDGVINHIFGTHISWLGSPSTAIWVLILLSVWQFGSSMLIFLSAMKQIPQSFMKRRVWMEQARSSSFSRSHFRCSHPQSFSI